MSKRNWNGICDGILELVNGLPYKPGLRWCFYRAIEMYSLNKKDWTAFKAAVARRRKKFKRGWKPETLEDTVRYPLWAGLGPASWNSFRENTLENAPGEGVWSHPETNFYVEVWYEAEAMTGQFQHYVQGPWRIPLRPFRGDYTIAPKWDVAQWLRRMVDSGREVYIIYFGDADEKGEEIPWNAMKDIAKWSKEAAPHIHFYVAGLSREQAKELELPENFERPGQWQWEALSDEQSHKIIMDALEELVDMPRLQDAIERADKNRKNWYKKVEKAVNRKPSKKKRSPPRKRKAGPKRH